MATAISRVIRRVRTRKVNAETVSDIEIVAETADEIRWIRRWPAVRLAVSRTPKARGRINRLIVSIRIRTGMSGEGVPSGRKWAREWVSWLRSPISTVASQRGTARPRLIDSWVVGVNVYGNKPSRFMLSRKTIIEVRRKAHLWAGALRGRRSCFVNPIMNQFKRVKSRLLVHRVDGSGKNSQGVSIARRINGVPNRVEEANWLNKSIVMVRIMMNEMSLWL